MATFTFSSPLYLWAARTDSWVFANLPHEASDEIEHRAVGLRRGFGAVRVDVTVGASTWRTSVFPSSADGVYVLPVKKAILKAEHLTVGDTITATVATVDI